MRNRQRFVKLLLLMFLTLGSMGGCSDKQQEKPFPDVPDGGLKGFKFHGSTPKRPATP